MLQFILEDSWTLKKDEKGHDRNVPQVRFRDQWKEKANRRQYGGSGRKSKPYRYGQNCWVARCYGSLQILNKKSLHLECKFQ